ncbi:PucR family transcriptional regulator [Patulibacter minatonensis]|uniref:PucR family transcriptional regulator n=1 Tax=Patulibacter minatonensis TaxID=298163 RepID=UPI000687F48C|nr:PucR family transcriptional regulator [Patulibacter minatonensis]
MTVRSEGQGPGASGTAELDVPELVQRLARDLLPRIGELADRVVDDVVTAVPELAPSGSDEELVAIRESTEQNVGAILSMLAFGVVPGAAEPPVGTIKVIRQAVAGGGDLVTMLRGFRMGHRAVSALWLEHLGDAELGDRERHEVVRYSSERLFTYFDGVSEQMAERYRQEYPDGGVRGGTSRRQALDDLLTGDDPDVDAASLSLGYDVRLHHLGVVVTLLDHGADPRAAIERLATAAGATAVLTQTIVPGSTWAWLGAPAPFTLEQVDALAALTVDGLRVGVGDDGRGPAGFRLTHEQARDAERYARAGAGSAGHVHPHRRVELAGLLCADPTRARRLAEARLGALAVREEATDRLRETLRTYLACGRNKARTGEVLHVHQKTVAYRLVRVETLLGGPLPDDCGELEAALLIDRTLDCT